MDLSSMRAQARQIKQQTSGFIPLFLVPILANIFSVIYRFNNSYGSGYNSGYNAGLTSTSSALTQASSDLGGLFSTALVVTMISGFIFTIIMSILLTFFNISAQFTTLDVLRGEREEVRFKDSLRAFNTDIFGKIFATVFLKSLFLFLWGLVALIGIYLIIFAIIAIGIAYIYGASNYIATLMPFLLIGLVVLIIGWALAIPQQYAYSQVEYILYDKLKNQDYTSAFSIIKESRRLMKGFKFKRFILDLTFIGWNILTGISFGLVGFHAIPYQEITNAIFYENLRQGNVE